MPAAVQSPIFSVVIPVFNVEDYIRDCIESVLHQKFTSFEVVCVDDGSQDRSIDIVREFDDPRIRIIHQANRGLAGARNSGINASKGIFIAMLDADDAWHPDKLALHFRHLQKNPQVGVSYSASLFIDEVGKFLGIGQKPRLKDIDAVEILCRNPVGNGSAAVIRKSLLLEMGRTRESDDGIYSEYFDESMRQSEDVDFWIRVALKSRMRFEGIPETLTYYRVNASGLSANLRNQYQTWRYSAEKNRQLNEAFYEEWFSLASAYQKRYLARRAIQNGNSKDAITLIHSALAEDYRILVSEPLRTLVTLGCAWLSLLPSPVFSYLLNAGMGSKFLRARA